MALVTRILSFASRIIAEAFAGRFFSGTDGIKSVWTSFDKVRPMNTNLLDASVRHRLCLSSFWQSFFLALEVSSTSISHRHRSIPQSAWLCFERSHFVYSIA